MFDKLRERLTGEFICADCKKRFNDFSETTSIHRCPYCNSTNWYTYENYKTLIKIGVTIK